MIKQSAQISIITPRWAMRLLAYLYLLRASAAVNEFEVNRSPWHQLEKYFSNQHLQASGCHQSARFLHSQSWLNNELRLMWRGHGVDLNMNPWGRWGWSSGTSISGGELLMENTGQGEGQGPGVAQHKTQSWILKGRSTSTAPFLLILIVLS